MSDVLEKRCPGWDAPSLHHLLSALADAGWVSARGIAYPIDGTVGVRDGMGCWRYVSNPHAVSQGLKPLVAAGLVEVKRSRSMSLRYRVTSAGRAVLRAGLADESALNAPEGRAEASMSSCTICDRPRRARDWCQEHYYRWWRWGDPCGTPPAAPPRPPDPHKHCEACRKLLRRRDNELRADFAKRRHCNLVCVGAARRQRVLVGADEKRCTRCERVQPLSEFAKRRNGQDTRCRSCHRAMVREWQAKHPERTRLNMKVTDTARSRLQRMYADEWAELRSRHGRSEGWKRLRSAHAEEWARVRAQVRADLEAADGAGVRRS